VPRAGLDPANVTRAGAALADEVGFDQLSMGLLAERLGVKAPSLYKHVAGLDDLRHQIAVLAMTEVGDALREATQGRAGRDALTAAAWAVRDYVREHPGRYTATTNARPSDPQDPLVTATGRVLDSFAAVLHGYRIDPDDQIHAMRMLRSVLHGFTTLEVAGSFQLSTDIDDSFTWIVDFLDHGLRTTTTAPAAESTPAR